jgi:hypothetical protein
MGQWDEEFKRRAVVALERIAAALESKAPATVSDTGWRVLPDTPEQLPGLTISDVVQVTREDVSGRSVELARYQHEVGDWNRSGVTAWRPLPPPYVPLAEPAPPKPEPGAMTAEEKLGAIRVATRYIDVVELNESEVSVFLRLHEILDAPLASPWRPIETAPDCGWYYAACEHNFCVWKTVTPLTPASQGWTHWAPIPPLPGKSP